MRYYVLHPARYPEGRDHIVGEVAAYPEVDPVTNRREWIPTTLIDAEYLTREELLTLPEGPRMLAEWEAGDDSMFEAEELRFDAEVEAEEIVSAELYRLRET